VAAHFYRSRKRELPLEIRTLERHPLGSQAFWPLQDRPYVVVVAPAGPEPDEAAVSAFLAAGHQAIQYHRGTWHHYQISLEADCDYLVLDREGPGDNCDEVRLAQPLVIMGSESSARVN
jgi:ureidoglycolate lyase